MCSQLSSVGISDNNPQGLRIQRSDSPADAGAIHIIERIGVKWGGLTGDGCAIAARRLSLLCCLGRSQPLLFHQIGI